MAGFDNFYRNGTIMLSNPFTPSEIACLPEDFVGREEELRLLERSLAVGSVGILGAIGIGKSSMLARVRLQMEGFNSKHRSKVVVGVGDKDLRTVDDMARLMLEQFVEVDEVANTVRLHLGQVFELGTRVVYNHFKAGRHLSALKRVVQEEVVRQSEFLILAIDEADKCPAPLMPPSRRGRGRSGPDVVY